MCKNYGDEIAKTREEIVRLNERLDALTEAIEAARPINFYESNAQATAREIARLTSLQGGA